MNIKQSYLLIALAVCGIIIAILLMRGCHKDRQMQEVAALHVATADSLKVSVNKLGQQEATIKVFEVSHINQFTAIATKDTTIRWLQATVKNYKGKLASATIAGSSTTSKGATATTIIRDTVFLPGADTSDFTEFLTFETSWQDRWGSGSIIAGKDSIYRDIKVRNEYEFTTGYGRWNPFRRPRLAVHVLNLNPNTETVELRSVTVKAPAHRFGVGFYAGYGITATMQGNVYHGVQVGVGASYRIWP